MITVTSPQQMMGQRFAQGARSWDQNLNPSQQAMLRSLQQGSGGTMRPYGSLSANSMTNQRRASLGAPMVTQGRTMNGMNPLAGTRGMRPIQAQPVGQPTTFQGQNVPRGTSQSVPQQTMGSRPQSGNFTYRGIGPEGNSVFTDPTTGEIFTMPAGASQGMTRGQGYSLPSAQPKTGLIGAEEAYAQGLDGALGTIQQGYLEGRDDINQGLSSSNQTLDAFFGPGQQASNYQAALSGALGPEAQAQAFEGYLNSPGFNYLTDQSERAIRRNAAATGGAGGANVQRALQENAIGLAAQDFGNAFNRLGSLSDRGLAAGGQMANNQMQAGNLLAGLGRDAYGRSGDMIYNTGQNLAQGRTRAGEMLANNIQGTTSNLSDLVYGASQDIANVTGRGSNALAQLLAQAGRDDLAANQAIATLLANLSQGTGSQVGGLPSLGGTGQQPGILGGVGNLLSGIGGLAGYWPSSGTDYTTGGGGFYPG